MRAATLASFAVLVSMSVPTSAEDLVLFHAAGSLRGALMDIAAPNRGMITAADSAPICKPAA